MTRHPYQLLGVRSLSNARRGGLKEVLLPILVGVSLGYVLGVTFTLEETDSEDHLVQIEHDVPESTLFFLRCIIIVDPAAKKALNFMTAIRDTYGSACNQTIYYTSSEEIKKKAADQYVVLVDSNANAFYWNHFKFALQDSAEVPAQWTFIGDEQVFLSVPNLRKLVRTVSHKRPTIFGRIFVQRSLLYYIFPFLQPERISVQSGMVLTTAAIKKLASCKGYFLPRATESTLYACAKEVGIRMVDPVDEEGMHLFHERDLKSMISEAYQADHQHKHSTSGSTCCSDHAISYGQMGYKEIRLADLSSLRWKVFGLGGIEEVNSSYAIDPSAFLPKTTTKPKTSPPKGKPKVAKQPTKAPIKPAKEEKQSADVEKKKEPPPK
ncbi:hypothetical protein ANCCAN_05222 [Ancylostoma caninum]|uniref:Uncharacterized protein n=1 Tax=Ancylostoma caninum TaxID=29170 RepID=A0A368H0K1_ANCCA|nr:hypothetical protein ANCCAN_05222 [Ancylostoma caninum]